MPRPNIRPSESEAPRSGAASPPLNPLRVAEIGEAAHDAAPSPARSLQEQLAEQFGEPSVDRYSKRTSLMFILAVCGGFWGLVGVAVVALSR